MSKRSFLYESLIVKNLLLASIDPKLKNEDIC